MIKIICADDHPIFLHGLQSLLERYDEVSVVGSCAHGDEILGLIAKHQPDIALVDIYMPGSNTEDIIRQTTKVSPSTKIMALTMEKNAYIARQLLEQGLSGYIIKDCVFDDLITAIQSVSNGKPFVSPCLLAELETEAIQLTEREKQILRQVSKGLANDQIGKALGISERTVRFHLSNCFTKLGVSSRSEAVSSAFNKGILISAEMAEKQ